MVFGMGWGGGGRGMIPLAEHLVFQEPNPCDVFHKMASDEGFPKR